MTDREQLENLMAHLEHWQQLQTFYFKTRSEVAKKDLRMKEDSLRTLLKVLRHDGYEPKKAVYQLPTMQDLFKNL